MAYTRVEWSNGKAPAIDATNLNRIEDGISEALEGMAKALGSPTYSSNVTNGNFLIGNGTDAMQEKTPAEVLELIGAGIAKMQIGSYTGTYTGTNTGDKILTFNGIPKLVIIKTADYVDYGATDNRVQVGIFFNGKPYGSLISGRSAQGSGRAGVIPVSWNNNTMAIPCYELNGNSYDTDCVYDYFAILEG